MKTVKTLTSIFAFPLVTLAAHLIASRILGLYAIFPHLDIPFHFIGGASISYTSVRGLGFLQAAGRIGRIDRLIYALLIFSLTAVAAVGWEWMEFGLDRLLGANIQVSLANTMQDQFFGLLGGGLAGAGFYATAGKAK